MKRLLIIKYGGSAITFKNQYETLNVELLELCTKQIENFYQQYVDHNIDIIIVHGAGSYGHFHAKKYELKTGGSVSNIISTNNNDLNNKRDQFNSNSSNNNSWQYGLALTRQSVLKLNAYVIDSLISKKIPATSISPFPTTRTFKQPNINKLSTNLDNNNNNNEADIVKIKELVYNDGIITPGSLEAIVSCLEQGLLPVLHGDVVLDASQRCSILSGDHIILWLCLSLHKHQQHHQYNDKSLHTNNNINLNSNTIDSNNMNSNTNMNNRLCGLYSDIRVIFLTDVQGVYSKAPHLPGAYLLPKIVVNSLDGSVDLQASTEVAVHDVTGGIATKLQSAIEISRLGIDVYIIKAGSADAYDAMLWKDPLIATKITIHSDN